MTCDAYKAYIRSQQVPTAWLMVLRNLAGELSANADPQSLHGIMVNVGERMAEDMQDRFQAIETLDDLQTRINDLWQQMNWGWVDFMDTQESIEITHHAAPLAEAFGDEALAWSVGLLQGFYQNLFRVLGADDDVLMNIVPDGTVGSQVQLRFCSSPEVPTP